MGKIGRLVHSGLGRGIAFAMISIVVPVRQAELTIADTLKSLMAQCKGQSVEIILAICEGDRCLTGVIVEEPARAIVIKAPAGIPQLRREASHMARGEYLVITEDHCLFPAGWVQNLVAATASRPGSVCGGPVANGRLTIVGWAQYFTRYAAFLPVGLDRTSTNLPGNNACYPRRFLEEHSRLLQAGFWEAEFNQELARSGIPFVLMQSLCVLQNQQRRMGEYVSLRFRHGRCYGARRFHKSLPLQKMKVLLGTPMLPALLYIRMLRSVLRAKWNTAKFFASSPLILVYVCAWSLGEITGYLTGAGTSCTETD